MMPAVLSRIRDWSDPIALFLGTVIFAGAVLAGFLIYQQTVRQLDTIVRARLVNTAVLAASMTNGDLHKTLTRPDQKTSAAYVRLQAPYLKILQANEDFIYVYTVINCGDRACLVLDAELPRTGETVTASGIMEVYQRPSSTLRQAMAAHAAAVEPRPYTDEYGTFLSAYAPIYDSHQTYVGVVGVDMSYRQYAIKVAKIRNSLAYGLFAAALFAIVVTVLVTYLRRRNQRLQNQYKSILTNITAVIFEGAVDESLTMSFINDYITTLTGYLPGDFLRNRVRPFSSLIPADELSAVKAGMLAQLELTQRYDVECRLIPRSGNGTLRHVWVRISGVLKSIGSDGAPIVEGYMQNITLRRAAELKVAESEKQFRTLADSMPNLLWITNTYGDSLFFNRTWLDYTGRTLNEDIDDGWFAHIHPEDKDTCIQKFVDALAEERAFQCWFRLQRHDGTYRWMLSDCTPRFTASGKCDGYVSAATDITERKLFENQLKSANAQLELFFKHTPAAIAVFDVHMRYLMVTQRALDDFGITEPDVIGKCLYDVMPRVPDEAKSLHALCLNGEVLREAEASFTRGDGSIEWYAYEMHPWFEGDEIMGIIVFTEFITERRRLDQELRQHRDNLQALVEGQTQAMRLESDKNILLRKIITSANESDNLVSALEACLDEICRFTGWSVGHCYLLDSAGQYLISSRGWSSTAKAQWPELVTWIDDFSLPLTAVSSVPAIVAMTGETVWLSSHDAMEPSPRSAILQANGFEGVVGFPVRVGGELIGVFECFAPEAIAENADIAALLVDIGLQFGRIIDRFQQEDNLRQAKELAEASVQAKSEFLSNMSHELRTPMHAILNYAGMGLKRVSETTPEGEKLGKYLGNIQIAGNRLLGLLNNLLDLAKMEAGKMTFSAEMQSFDGVVDHTRMELDSLLKAKHLTLQIDYLCADRVACFDHQRLIQVLVNLFSNAIKFSPEGSTLTLAVSTPDADWLTCEISDQGPGIPSGELEQIFDTFIQSSDTKSGAGGTGLGLSICKQIIAAHGGRIWAENNPDGGARVCFVMPRTPAAHSTLRLAGE